MKPAIFWHRRDLRPYPKSWIPVFIPDLENLGSASLWWQNQALHDLIKTTQDRLLIRRGDPTKILLALAKKTGASTVYWNTIWEPALYARDMKIRKELEKEGVDVCILNENHLIDPSKIFVKPEHPYRVFTPFYKAALKEISELEPFKKHASYEGTLASESTHFKPEKWMHKLEAHWTPTRTAALKKLRTFVEERAGKYGKQRDLPWMEGTSKLSPYLHFGQLSPHEIWESAHGHEPYLRQLIWREFATYFLYHFPHVAKKNWNEAFDKFQWSSHPSDLKKWRKGMTGYPIVDAGMRQLWETGWMHNRVRMIVASFLTKDLLIDWRKGEEWFWDTLVDADKANNVLGWQWVAGSGPDAAPYFRIFNPILQGNKFDPDGEYVKKFVPELKKLPPKWIHCPWEAPDEVLTTAGIQLGKTYPLPIVDHAEARERALKTYSKIRSKHS